MEYTVTWYFILRKLLYTSTYILRKFNYSHYITQEMWSLGEIKNKKQTRTTKREKQNKTKRNLNRLHIPLFPLVRLSHSKYLIRHKETSWFVNVILKYVGTSLHFQSAFFCFGHIIPLCACGYFFLLSGHFMATVAEDEWWWRVPGF